jgi:hypothetical protein
MGVKYEKYVNDMDPQSRASITRGLKSCFDPKTLMHIINAYYNRNDHFCNGIEFDTGLFLAEIERVAKSADDNIIVMGSVHSCPFGHSTMLIGQYNPMDEYVQCIAQDHYIRFKLENKSKSKYKLLNQSMIYHFLVKTPTVVILPLGTGQQVTMYSTDNPKNHKKLLPTAVPKYEGKIMYSFV